MVEPLWDAWGSADERPQLDAEARAFLRAEVGDAVPSEAVGIEQASLGASRLPAAAEGALVGALGRDGVQTDRPARLRHAGGQSYGDLVRRRSGDVAAPDAVLLPGSDDDVAKALAVCSEHRVAVVPFGGGTSVVGGVEPDPGQHSCVVALDLSRLDRLLDVDPVSLTATVEAGMTTPALEAALSRHGLTLGHAPQSWQRATVGGYAVTRSAGQASSGVGRFDDLVLGLTMVTPRGVLELPAQAGSAAGPDLRRLVMGSEGTLGVVTRVVLRVRRLARASRFEGHLLPDFAAGREVFRELAQRGTTADVMRLSDEEETRVALGLTGPRGRTRRALEGYLRLRGRSGGCLFITGYEGEPADVEHRRQVVIKALRSRGAVSLGAAAGRSWEHGRFAGPHLRDTLLDAGYLVETLETAALWSGLEQLHQAVGAALRGALAEQGTPALVGCHISHVYSAGASLYFTVLTRRRPGAELEQWAAAKHAAGEAIVRAGGTITHHHGVGRDHRPWIAPEVSALGVSALAALKAHLDPAGVLNPGKLLPPA